MLLIDLPGDKIRESDLVGRRAIEIVKYLQAGHSNYLRLTECRRKSDTEIVILEIDVEVAPRRPVRIAPCEPIMIICPREGSSIPMVVPLRQDFPDEQLHVTNHEDHDFVSLCLWDTPQEDQKARFTPFVFLARIKEWLELAAEGKLHQPEQGAEPVLTGTSVEAIIPAGPIDPDIRYVAYGRETVKNALTVRFFKTGEERLPNQSTSHKFVLIPITTGVVCGRAVRSAPRTLTRLATVIADHDGDLVEAITRFVTSVQNEVGLGDAMPVILATFPKSSEPDGEIESQEHWAFSLNDTVAEIGVAMGAYDTVGGYTAALIGQRADPDKLPELSLEPMIVIQELEPEAVPQLSGWDDDLETKCFGIGAGALGSKIIELSLRGGFGRWKILDKDVFHPHNSIRHVLGDWAIGDPKAENLRHFLNQAIPGERVQQAFVEDIENVEGLSDELRAAISEADLVIDASASVSVSRALTQMDSVPRSVSLFFNPGATDLVMLAEDAEKAQSLFDLEASYYAALISDDRLGSHLFDVGARTIRYGNGCSDLTARIGPDQVGILSGIGSKALRQVPKSDCAQAKIWRLQDDGSVSVVEVPISDFRGEQMEEWEVRWSNALIEKLSKERTRELPNETGGILLGVVDFDKRMISICTTIEAPPDSVKRPHYFERGQTGLEMRLKEIGAATAGQLRYMGEWHSHPKNVPARPSAHDDGLFSVLGRLFKGTGEPHIMAIISDDELFARIGLNDAIQDMVLTLWVIDNSVADMAP